MKYLSFATGFAVAIAMLFALSYALVPGTPALNDYKQATVKIILPEVQAIGTGVVVSDNEILTAAHVAEDGKKIIIQFSSGEYRSAHIKWVDRDLDAAVLVVEDMPKVDPAIVRCTEPVWGEPVMTLGFPLDMDYALSEGIVSSTQLGDPSLKSYVLTSIFVNHGNSGGPVFDKWGEVIGIVSAFRNLQDVGGPGLIVPTSRFCNHI